MGVGSCSGKTGKRAIIQALAGNQCLSNDSGAAVSLSIV